MFLLSSIINITLNDGLTFSQLLKDRPDEALEYLYKKYYETMCKKVFVIVNQKTVAEDIVQEIFVELWSKKDVLFIQSSLEAYLSRACKNRSINYLKREFKHFDEDSILEYTIDDQADLENKMIRQETEATIQEIIDQLPEKCRLIFNLSRFENMTYREISEQLDIAQKTVENQIGKALKIIRSKFKNNE